MTILRVDVETFSSVDLKASGMHRYVESPDFEILLFGFAFDDDPVEVIDLTDFADLPKDVVRALETDVIKTAYNAAFERGTIGRHFGIECDPRFWRCTSVHALTLGLPGYLEGVAEVLKLPVQKDTRGKALIKYFSVPCKPTKVNGGRTRNHPHHDPEKWLQYIEYNRQDVVVEREIARKLERFPVPAHEQKLWALDQRINDRGVRLDPVLVRQAIACDEQYEARLVAEAQEITGLDNPNSLTQLKGWLAERGLETPDGLSKEFMPVLLDAAPDDETRRVLEIRREMGKTSVDKYNAMQRSICSDDRARGLLQFEGANRTGRWCLTGDHEVLTPDGWIRFDNWSGGQIACWSPQTEFISFQKAGFLAFDYQGDLYELESQRCSQLSTPEHQMAYWGKAGGWKVETVERLAAKRFSIPFTGRRTVHSNLDHVELRILVMVQADGHYTQEGDLRFHFSKQRKIERCKSLLRKSNLIFTEMDRKKSTVITIKSRFLPIWLRTFREKVFGSWLLDESADVVFDELEHWDAYRCGPNSIQYTTTKKQNADYLQALAHLSGRAATVTVKKRDNANWSDAYVVNIWLTPGGRNEIRNKPRLVPYSGKVYCAETETGFFIVRRNGKVWITGNSGRLIQVQNLPQNKIDDLALARETLRNGDFDLLEMLYGAPPFVLSQLIRTAFIPSVGCRFIVSDFSAIEARVVAWLADEKWVLDVFRGHGKIYEATAAQMFGVPFETIVKGHPNYDLRARGKVAVLACGYQGGENALAAMDTKKEIDPAEYPRLVRQWRDANPNIRKLWFRAEEAAIRAVLEKTTVQLAHGVRYRYEAGMLFADLPSGRSLTYVNPTVKVETIRPKDKEPIEKECLSFWGMDQVKKKWEKQRTYGGRLVENLVQAIARDCLAESLKRLDDAGFTIVMHVHDEVVLDEPIDGREVGYVTEIMSQPIDWAPDLPLAAAGFECDFYQKD